MKKLIAKILGRPQPRHHTPIVSVDPDGSDWAPGWAKTFAAAKEQRQARGGPS